MPTLSVVPNPAPRTRPVDPDHDAEMALVSKLLQDDPIAWSTFSRHYGPAIHHAIARVTRRFSGLLSTDDANEIYSIFLLQLLQNDKHKLRCFDTQRGKKLSSWLRLLATHAAYDFLRKCRRDPQRDEGVATESFASAEPDPFSRYLTREENCLASELLATLSERDRELVRLYFIEGLEPEVVAERMGISVKTVYSKKHKLCARLESLVERSSLAA